MECQRLGGYLTEPHQNKEVKEEAKVAVLTIEWIVPLPGSLQEVRNSFGTWYQDLSFVTIVSSEEMHNDMYNY